MSDPHGEMLVPHGEEWGLGWGRCGTSCSLESSPCRTDDGPMAPPPGQTQTAPVLTDQLDADQPLRPCLFHVFSPKQQILTGGPIRLQPGLNRIGREAVPPPPIPLSGDNGLSRDHAQLAYDETKQVCTLLDTSSHQSSWVNGVHLVPNVPHRLQPQDVIRLGDSVLVFVWAPESYFAVFAADAERPSESPAAKLLGRAPAIVELRRKLAAVARAPEPFPLLLLGESGTGKERAAEEFHIASGRGPFRAVNCAVLEAASADSTLFGHIRGSFTGSVQNRDGLFVAAHTGTIFLDEVAELPADVQSKLLRILDERKVHRMGEEEKAAQPVDVFVVAATSRPLGDDLRAGTFRFDLFRRLRGISLRVPSLRSRREDILYLLQHAPAASKATGEPIAIPALPPLNTSQVELLLLHHWPGNVGDLLLVRGHITNLGFDRDLRERLREPTPCASATEPTFTPPPASAHPAASAPLAPQPPFAAAIPKAASNIPAPSTPHHKEPRPDAARLRELLVKHSGKLMRVEYETGWDRHTLRDDVRKFGLETLMNELRRGN